MPFLTADDYKLQIRADVLDKVTDSDAAIAPAAELATLEEMTSYLKTRYDVAAIFEATGGDRNPLLVMYAVDILLYHIHSRINPRQIPELRFVRYEAAINWLKSVSKGLILPTLPLNEDPDGEGANDNAGTTGMYTFQKRTNTY